VVENVFSLVIFVHAARLASVLPSMFIKLRNWMICASVDENTADGDVSDSREDAF
jgi:hypothetical protein